MTFNNAGREYAAADFRWGVSDPGVVSLELLTVFGAGPLGCFILAQLAKQDPARHYWIVVLSTAELYGGHVESFSPPVLIFMVNLQMDDFLSRMVDRQPEP